MAKYKCREKYFGFKISEEYKNHCANRERNAKSGSSKDFWRMCKEKGSWL